MAEMVAKRPRIRLKDFGFYHPYEDVERMVGLLEASSFQCWPSAGGLEDQDSLWIHDIETFLTLKARAEWERDHPDEDDDEEPKAEEQEEKAESIG